MENYIRNDMVQAPFKCLIFFFSDCIIYDNPWYNVLKLSFSMAHQGKAESIPMAMGFRIELYVYLPRLCAVNIISQQQ